MSKECPYDKVFNKKSNRCVNMEGRIGKKILKDMESNKSYSKSQKIKQKNTRNVQKIKSIIEYQGVVYLEKEK